MYADYLSCRARHFHQFTKRLIGGGIVRRRSGPPTQNNLGGLQVQFVPAACIPQRLCARTSVLSSPGLYERDHERCHQNKDNDDRERFKVSHSADLCQVSHPLMLTHQEGSTRATIRIVGCIDALSGDLQAARGRRGVSRSPRADTA